MKSAIFIYRRIHSQALESSVYITTFSEEILNARNGKLYAVLGLQNYSVIFKSKNQRLS
jgi:hypothetical protein